MLNSAPCKARKRHTALGGTETRQAVKHSNCLITTVAEESTYYPQLRVARKSPAIKPPVQTALLQHQEAELTFPKPSPAPPQLRFPARGHLSGDARTTCHSFYPGLVQANSGSVDKRQVVREKKSPRITYYITRSVCHGRSLPNKQVLKTDRKREACIFIG